MSENRLEILQLLADGKINAEQAAAMMNGGAAPEVVEDSAELIDPIIEKQPEEIIEIEIDEEPVLIAKVKSDEATKGQQSRLHVVISGNPVKANLDIEVPLSLLEIGQQIGAMFSQGSSGKNWSDINFEADSGEQHIHIYTEQAQ